MGSFNYFSYTIQMLFTFDVFARLTHQKSPLIVVNINFLFVN